MISLQRCTGEDGGGGRKGEARLGSIGAGSHVGQESGTYQSVVCLLGVQALVMGVLAPVAVLVAAALLL